MLINQHNQGGGPPPGGITEVAFTLKAASVTDPIDTTGANLIVVGISTLFAATGMSDSKGNTWTQLTPQAGGSAWVTQFYCANPTVGSGHTFTSPDPLSVIGVVAVSGANASPFDQESGSATGSATSIQPGSLTPGTNGSLICTAVNDGFTTGLSLDSGFTYLTGLYTRSGNYGGGFGYLIQNPAAPINPTWAWTSGASGAATSMAVFKP